MNSTLKRIESKPLIIIIGSLVILMVFSICFGMAGIAVGSAIKTGVTSQNFDTSDLATRCLNQGGVWVTQTKECEKVSEPFCRSAGGVFDACASPCRNASGQVMCVQMCVQVCTFK